MYKQNSFEDYALASHGEPGLRYVCLFIHYELLYETAVNKILEKIKHI